MTQAVAAEREISLGGWRFPIMDEPRRLELSRFPAKLVTGDVTEANEQSLSSYSMKDFTGGILVKEMDESTQGDRAWYSLAEIMRSRWVGLPPYAHECSGQVTVTYATIAFVATTKKITDSGNHLAVFKTGDSIRVSGATTAANNGVKTIATGNVAGEIVISEALTDESAGATVTITRIAATPNFLFTFASGVYACQGTKIVKWNDTTQRWGQVLHTFTGTVVNSCEYGGKIYLARGADGYSYSSDGSSWTDVAGATETAQAFCVFDGTLYKLEPGGAVESSTDGTTWGAVVTLPWPSGDYTTMFEYVNLSGDPALHVAHRRGIDYIDATNKKFYRSGLQVPRHAQGGRGCQVWRGDAVAYFAGLTGYMYTPGSIRVIGLDRDDGVPVELRGNVIDLAQGNAVLFAALDNSTVDSTPPSSNLTTTFGMHQPKVGSRSSGTPMILAYNGTGWFPIWKSPVLLDTIKCIMISDAHDYRIWAAAGGTVFYGRWPSGVYNPKESADSEYAEQGELITPWHDGNMPTELKTAVDFSLAGQDLTSTETVTAYYATDYNEGWTLIGQYTTNSPAVYEFGSGAGLAYHAIRFRFLLQRAVGVANVHLSPWFKAKLRYERLLPKLWGWEARVDCRAEYGGHSAKQLGEKLLALSDPASSDGLLVEFAYKYRTPASHWVRLSLAGQEASGREEGGVFTLRLSRVG